jgi:hypothetical protein
LYINGKCVQKYVPNNNSGTSSLYLGCGGAKDNKETKTKDIVGQSDVWLSQLIVYKTLLQPQQVEQRFEQTRDRYIQPDPKPSDAKETVEKIRAAHPYAHKFLHHFPLWWKLYDQHKGSLSEILKAVEQLKKDYQTQVKTHQTNKQKCPKQPFSYDYLANLAKDFDSYQQVCFPILCPSLPSP